MSLATVTRRARRPQTTSAVLYGVTATIMIAVVYGVARQEPLGSVVVVGVGLSALAVAAVVTPRVVICVGAGSSLVPLPGTAPFAVVLGGGTLYLVDILVFVAALLCFHEELRPTFKVCLGASSLFLLVGLIGSVIGNPNLGLLGRDARGPLQLIFGIVIGLAVIHDFRLRTYLLRTLSAVLWYGVAVIALNLIAGVNLIFAQVDETQSTLIDNVRATYDTTRFQLQVNNVATLILCAAIALLLVGQARPRQVMLPYLLPSAFLSFESFSRNSILALAVVCIVSGVIAVRHGAMASTIGRTLLGIVTITAMALFTYYMLSFTAFIWGGSNPLTAQVAAYKGRVLDGLYGSNLQGDASWQWRQLEWGFAKTSFEDAPIFGHGFGYSYRPVLQYDPFGRLGGTVYVHNWYAWILIKTGIAGAVLVAMIFLGPLAKVVIGARSGTPIAGLCTAVLASTLSALAVMTVSPLVEASGSALYVGAVAGAAWALHDNWVSGHPPERQAVVRHHKLAGYDMRQPDE